MPTQSCLVAPPCTLVLLTVCKRRLLPLHHPPSRLRSLLLLKGNTLYGLEVLSWLLSQLSNKCGFPNKNMMNLAHPSSTGSASKAAKLILPTVAIFFISGYDPLGVASEAPHQHFLSFESVLFNNKSFQTNLHFWISFICIYFLFFSQNFVSPTPAFAHPSSFQNFKMKK